MIVAVVLAAGRSERLGRLKPLLPCGGTTFLGAILDAVAASRVDALRVVLGHGAEQIRSAVALAEGTWTVNPEPGRGMLSSVQCGIRSLPRGTRGFLLWPVDHPLVRVETVDRLVDAFSRGDPAVVLPVHDGRRGHPVLFSSRLAVELMEAPAADGARAVVHAHEADRVELAVDDPGVVTDIDTPEAFAATFGVPPPD